MLYFTIPPRPLTNILLYSRSPGHRVPWWVLIWIKRSPLVFLVLSVACFSVGLVLFAYSSKQAGSSPHIYASILNSHIFYPSTPSYPTLQPSSLRSVPSVWLLYLPGSHQSVGSSLDTKARSGSKIYSTIGGMQ